jgi:hypothetical protein
VGKVRPEQGLLALRVHFDLYANVRPALFPSKSLLSLSPLKESVAEGTDLIVVRELVKGLYIGEKTEADLTPGAAGEAADVMRYNRADVERITRLAAFLALQSSPPKKLHSIDKANVLACSRLWRHVVQETVDREFAAQGVEVDHQLVDSAAMVIVSNPRKLNGIVLSAWRGVCVLLRVLTARLLQRRTCVPAWRACRPVLTPAADVRRHSLRRVERHSRRARPAAVGVALGPAGRQAEVPRPLRAHPRLGEW